MCQHIFIHFMFVGVTFNIWKRQISTTTKRKRSAKTRSHNMSHHSNLQEHLYSFPIHCAPVIVITWKSSICQPSEGKLSTHQLALLCFATYLKWGRFRFSFLTILHKMSWQLTILNWFSFTLPDKSLQHIENKGLELNLRIQFSIYHATL